VNKESITFFGIELRLERTTTGINVFVDVAEVGIRVDIPEGRIREILDKGSKVLAPLSLLPGAQDALDVMESIVASLTEELAKTPDEAPEMRH
jgi:hypothetical protein